MLETQIKVLEKPKLKNPVCFIGLPGIGHIGRIAVEYLVHETKAKKFAELYSPYFFPFIIVHENRIHTLRNEFYWTRQKGKDYIFLIGDVQTYDPKGHYEVAGKILDLLKGLGCKKVVTIGGFSTGNVSEKPKVFAVLNSKEQEAEFKGSGVEMKVSGQIATVVGASGLLPGLADLYGMAGYCLLGETSGFPIITDPTAASAVLRVIQKIYKINFDLNKLKAKVEAMHDFIKKLHDIQSQAMDQLQKTKGKEELKYIG